MIKTEKTGKFYYEFDIIEKILLNRKNMINGSTAFRF